MDSLPRFDVKSFWRAKLDEAQRRYSDNPTAEALAKYEELLRVLADFVVRGQLPPPEHRVPTLMEAPTKTHEPELAGAGRHAR
jgi:hypothetical protein